MLNEEKMVLELSNCEICDIRMAITGLKHDMQKEFNDENTSSDRKKVLSGSIKKWDRLYNKIVGQHEQQIERYEKIGSVEKIKQPEKEYAALEPDKKLYQLIKCMDARQSITLWQLEKYEDSIIDSATNPERISDVHYVYELFDKKYQDIMEEYVIDYMRFDIEGVVVAIKPNKWYKV